jgi:hypothetical protein
LVTLCYPLKVHCTKWNVPLLNFKLTSHRFYILSIRITNHFLFFSRDVIFD